MIGAIIGDIVGSRFEFAKQTTPNFTLFDKDCNYTDETICNVAIADAILNKKHTKTLFFIGVENIQSQWVDTALLLTNGFSKIIKNATKVVVTVQQCG